MTKRQYPETALQKACVQLLTVYEGLGRLRFYAVPNVGKRTPAYGAHLKAQGLRPGVPDIVVLTFGRSTYLELKSPDGKLSPVQENWRDWLTEHGHQWALIRSLDDLKTTLGIILQGGTLK